MTGNNSSRLWSGRRNECPLDSAHSLEFVIEVIHRIKGIKTIVWRFFWLFLAQAVAFASLELANPDRFGAYDKNAFAAIKAFCNPLSRIRFAPVIILTPRDSAGHLISVVFQQCEH